MLRLEPCLGAAHLHDPGPAAQAASRRSLRARRASRRHQRALVLVHDQRRQRTRHAAGRGPQLRRGSTAAALPAEGGGRQRRRPAARRGGDGSARRAGTCSASSSTTWGRSRITCTRARSTRAASAAAASPRRTTSRRSTTRPTTTFPYTFMGLEPGTTKDDVRRCLENWNKGDNGILYLSRAYRLEPRHRLADQSRHPARAGLARHLRAAGEQRRVRDVPVGGRRPDHRRGTC